MDNVIIIVILVMVIALAALYVYKEKKKGNKCIGCPHSNECKSKCSNE